MTTHGHRHLAKGETLTTAEFIDKAKAIHGDKYDYSDVEYLGSKAKVRIVCRKHGTFWQPPADHLSGHSCRKCFNDSQVRWSIDEDDLLRAHYQDKGAYWCAHELGKTDHAVRGRAQILKLTKRQKTQHPHVPASFWNALLGRVRQDGYLLDFDAEFIWQLYLKQHGKCALTGWEIIFSRVSKENTVSIDRIDSSKDYTKDNVQLTHKMVNRCKLNTPESWFFEMCKAVCGNRKDLALSPTVELEDDILNDTVRPVIKTRTVAPPI